jgi:SlyX protein
MADQTQLEEQIAHLARVTDDLSEVVIRQEKEIARLTRLVARLSESVADSVAGREAEAGGTVVPADQKPPHW